MTGKDNLAGLLTCAALVLGCSQGDERVADMFGGGDGDGSGADDGGDGGDDGSGGGDDGGSGDDGDGVKYDVDDGDGGAGDEGDCDCGNFDWSYVFIANSQEGTISKINTRTLEEEGRYLTGGGSPSRTSVSIDGKAVVVANRHGGLAKYWIRTDLCDPNANGQPGLQTSTGKADVLPFGQDDCLDWFVSFKDDPSFPAASVQRPVQWTTGEGPCHKNQKVWTVTGTGGTPGMCSSGGIWVHRLNGDDGTIEDTLHIPNAEFSCDITGLGTGQAIGPYGGAVDYDGNFWFHGFEQFKLIRVDFATLGYEIFGGGGYGITVDTEGRVWTSSSIARFDYDTKDRQSANVSTSGGIAQDLQGRIWAAGQSGVVWVDMETLAIGDSVPLPVTNQVKGVSVDIDGFIWAVAQDDTRAFKIDPDTYQYEIYDGLNGPYTYSDMTGGAVYNVGCNPPEG